jgi:hypothetical protein
MKQYIYYNKFDQKQEPYGKVEAQTKTEAILIASSIKQMSIENFIKIFEVEEDGKVQKPK